jgi:hypothetical protein
VRGGSGLDLVAGDFLAARTIPELPELPSDLHLCMFTSGGAVSCGLVLMD